MDKVFIEGLEIESVIGIYDWERKIRQPLVFDIEMAFDNRKPAASDDIADTLDYTAVVAEVKEFVAAREEQLLERLAEKLCERLGERFRPLSIVLRVDKPVAARLLGCRAVGVSLRREFA